MNYRMKTIWKVMGVVMMGVAVLGGHNGCDCDKV